MLVDANPGTIRPGSPRVHQWCCPEGPIFDRPVAGMVRRSSTCPFCKGPRVKVGENDLTTRCPDIAAEWHPNRNGDLTPADVTAGSERLVWWLCARGHDYQAPILNRAGRKAGCTICSRRMLVSGLNDLATRYPDIARDWDADRNGTPAAQMFPGKQLRRWTCSRGHTQHKLCNNRLRSGGCTSCEPEDRVAWGTRKSYKRKKPAESTAPNASA